VHRLEGHVKRGVPVVYVILAVYVAIVLVDRYLV
jgi:hypothetical protein